MSNQVNVYYSYPSTNHGTTKIWTSLPMEPKNHPQNIVHHITHNPIQTTTDDGGNTIYYFSLEEGEHFQFHYTTEAYTPNGKAVLSEEEQAYYLRSGDFVSINDEVKNLATNITSNADNPIEKARLLFNYLVDNYKYVYPPKSRGVPSFMESKKGDCGEYSFLFTALSADRLEYLAEHS